jgi:hypothetical protein
MTNFRLCLVGAAAVTLGAQSASAACADPVAAVMATMDCIQTEDLACVSAGYDSSFMKFHNQVVQVEPYHWEDLFKLVDIDMTFDRQFLLNPTTVSLRYEKKIKTTDGSDFGARPSTRYPFSRTLTQHEHALVTVNDNCTITQWSQTGDNAEQFAADAINTEVRCALELETGDACQN